MIHKPDNRIEHLRRKQFFAVHVAADIDLPFGGDNVQRHGPLLAKPPATANALIKLFVTVIHERDDVGTMLKIQA